VNPAHFAVVAGLFPPETPAVAFFPHGTALHTLQLDAELAGAEVAAVVLFSDSAAAEDCGALRFLQRLRTNSSLPETVRSIPVLVLSPHSLETLLHLDPRFLAFASPAVALVTVPCAPEAVLARAGNVPHAKTADVARYLNLEGRLARLRHLARHELANALGPRVLLASAVAAGAVTSDRANSARAAIKARAPGTGHAEEYESLSALLAGAGPPAASPRTHSAPLARLARSRLRILSLDDEHAAGWPEALAACLRLTETPPAGTSLPVRSFVRGSFCLDCWAGSDCADLERTILPPPADYPQPFPYDAVFLDLRLRREGPEVPTAELSGCRFLRALRDTDPSASCVLFTASRNALHLRELLLLGAAGYYLKEEELPVPPAANWSRLEQSLQTLIEGRSRRRAFWALSDALARAASRPWYSTGDERARDRLVACVYHLQALLLLPGGPPSRVMDLRMDRHVVESAHSVMEAALRHRFGASDAEQTNDLIERRLRGLPRQYDAAKALNRLRNEIVHRRLSGYGDEDHADRLCAVSAACYVLSEEASGADEALAAADDFPAARWPSWLPRRPPPFRNGVETTCRVIEVVRSADGSLRHLLAEEEGSGEELRVVGVKKLPPGRQTELAEGAVLRVQLQNALVRPPEAVLRPMK
jgi:CheY-like chemotaxis protein